MSIAQRLKNKRLETGYSIEKLSELSNITTEEINEIEESKNDKKIIKKFGDVLQKIAKPLQTNKHYLLTGEINLALRLKKRRLEMGYTQASLGQAANIPQQLIDKLENEVSNTSVHLPAIAKALKTTTEYLLNGEMVLSSYLNEPPSNKEGVEILKEFNSAVRLIPIVGWNINSITRIENMTVSSKLSDAIPSFDPCGPNVKAFRIKDDSMVALMPNTDSFLEGDIIVVDPDKDHDKGSFVIAEIKGKPEFVFRQVIDIAGELFLSPLNPKYDKDKLDDNIKIFGTLTTKYRKYS